MRTLILFLAACGALFAQPAAGSLVIEVGSGQIPMYVPNVLGIPVVDSSIQYSWSITRAPNGVKQFTFTAKQCAYFTSTPTPFTGLYFWTHLPMPKCTTLTQSQAENLGPIAEGLLSFYNYHPDAPHDPPIYNPKPPGAPPSPSLSRALATGAAPHPELTGVPPLTPPDPQMVFLDGLSQNLLQYDLTAQKITSTVIVPSTTGPLGIRPVSTGAQHEVWTANAGTGVTVSDLTTQSVVTNIPTPSLPQAAAPAGIVFSPDGTTAFEAVGFFSADSSGNLGALVVFDAVHRQVTSTFPLKNAPSAVLTAPDGYTIYLLSSNGMLTYYDVLSGTADLSVSTFTPGGAGGYPGSAAQVFLTPDGTHLYWNVNYLIVGFDLTARKISSSVNSGLSSSSQSTMYMAQDGIHIWLTSADGTVAVYDVSSGGVIATFTADPQSAIYIGPAN
ncbi:MAG TPA: hypothetical protein VI756_17390 [Blastocatellia bacterium]